MGACRESRQGVTAVLLCLGLAALVVGTTCGLYATGLRAGDRADDKAITAVEADETGSGIWFTVQEKLLVAQHELVCAIGAGEAQTLRVERLNSVPRRAELIIAVGEADRLRVIHRAIEAPRLRSSRRRRLAAGLPESMPLARTHSR